VVWLFAYAAAIAREPGVARGIKLFSEEISRDMSMLGICTLDEMHAGRLVRGNGITSGGNFCFGVSSDTPSYERATR
jgi:isopentenyl diphosphate isomerase/L-lactate dehydrogenase-like FMN-dependent dehydrogenase